MRELASNKRCETRNYEHVGKSEQSGFHKCHDTWRVRYNLAYIPHQLSVYIYYFYDLVLMESGFRVKGTKKLIKFKAVNLTHSNGRFEQL